MQKPRDEAAPDEGAPDERTSIQALEDLLRAGALGSGSSSLDLYIWKKKNNADTEQILVPLASSRETTQESLELDLALARRFLKEREDLYLPQGLADRTRSKDKQGSIYLSRVGNPDTDALGLLVSEHPNHEGYELESRRLLAGLARVCGDLMQAEETRSGLVQDRAALSTALKIGKGLTASLEVDEVMRDSLGSLLDLTGAATGFFVLFSEADGSIGSVVPVGYEAKAVKEALAQPEVKKLVDRVLTKGEILLVDSISTGGRLPAALSKALRVLPQKVLLVPLLKESSAIGMLKLDGYTEESLSPTQVRIVRLLSDLLVMALQNAGLHLDMARQAERDLLTGLYNRQGFILRSEVILKRAALRDESYSIALIDLDHFKKVNDTWGHGEGDKVLKDVSRCLEEVLHDGPLIGRWGGEEFMILFPKTIKKEAHFLLQKVGKLISESVMAGKGDEAWPVTMSGGVTGQGSGQKTFEQLVEAVDRALYRAKENGRNRIEDADE